MVKNIIYITINWYSAFSFFLLNCFQYNLYILVNCGPKFRSYWYSFVHKFIFIVIFEEKISWIDPCEVFYWDLQRSNKPSVMIYLCLLWAEVCCHCHYCVLCPALSYTVLHWLYQDTWDLRQSRLTDWLSLAITKPSLEAASPPTSLLHPTAVLPLSSSSQLIRPISLIFFSQEFLSVLA